MKDTLKGRPIRRVVEYANGVLTAPDGTPVRAICYCDDSMPPVDGRPLMPVSTVLDEGEVIYAVSAFPVGTLVTPDGRPVYARVLCDANGVPGSSPAMFFAASEPGAWYDTSDLTTMYQDSAGVTPAVVGQPVGLLLDKRLGLVRGAELMPDPEITTATGWTLTNGATISGGAINFGTTVGTQARYPLALSGSAGSTFEITIVMRARPSNSARLQLGNSSSGFGADAVIFLNAGTNVFKWAASNPALSAITLEATGTAGDAVVESVSVKPLPGNHATQATTSAKPVLRQHYDTIGAELVPNGGFADATGWSVGASWTITGGAAVKAAGAASYLYVTSPFVVAGKTYAITFTIGNYTAGNMTVRLGTGGTEAISSSYGAAGTYTAYLTANPGNTQVAFVGVSAGDFSIDNVSVKEATANGYYLEFDGVDDYLRSTFTIAQPWDRISAVQQISWTVSDRIFGGGSADAGLGQSATTPELELWDGGTTVRNGGLPIGANGVVTETHDTTGRVAVNNGAYASGAIGTNLPGGITIGARHSNLNASNIRFYGTIMRQGSLSDADIAKARTYLGSKSGLTL